MRALLICHHDDPVDRVGLSSWLASFTELAGVVVVHEERRRVLRRLRRELGRVGWLRFMDVLAFRAWYGVTRAAEDRSWLQAQAERLRDRYGPIPAGTPVHETASPNDPRSESFMRDAAPDILIARCKFILARRVFTIPGTGTFVLHPGICPEYRNAHGCFWALARGDVGNVGATLLQIDEGIDTGPVFGYYRPDFDERRDSHVVIQYRAVLDHLDEIARRLAEIHAGTAMPLDTEGRASGVWGQPWLTRYLAWKRRAGRETSGPETGG